MRPSSLFPLLLCACVTLSACGGSVVEVSGEEPSDTSPLRPDQGASSRDLDGWHDEADFSYDDDMGLGSELDMAAPRDLGVRPVDQGAPPREEMGGGPVDMAPPAEDLSQPVDMSPPPVDQGMPPQGPPPSDSVETVKNAGCSTAIVKGLSQQLIDQMNCIDPGVVSSFSYLTNLNLYSAVFPFLQSPAVNALDRTVAGQNTLTISSALRTLPQQYLLYRWYREGKCSIGLAATPGNSNHNGARAIDTPDRTAWKTRLEAQGWKWLGSNDPVHFDYTSGGKDIRSLSVLAFQQLWNKNHPNDTLVEDGAYGPNTESRLKQAPSNGFAIPPWCPASRQDRLEATALSPTVRLDWQPDSPWLTLLTLAPKLAHQVDYARPSEAHHLELSPETPQFQVSLALDAGRAAPLEVIAVSTRDARGELLRTTFAALPTAQHAISLLPESGGIYRLHHHAPPAEAASMRLLVDGVWIAPDVTSAPDGPFDLLLNVRHRLGEQRQLAIEVLDARGEVIERLELRLTLAL